jgi:hypothetical protein
MNTTASREDNNMMTIQISYKDGTFWRYHGWHAYADGRYLIVHSLARSVHVYLADTLKIEIF